MIILDHEQGTDEWLAARLGKPSASNFGKLITATGKPSTSAVGYINQLIAERFVGKSEPFYVNDHMARGTELEPEAREAYEFITGKEVIEFGFILDDSKDKPSESDCTNGLATMQSNFDNKEYSRNRANEYPSIADQLDDIYHNGIDAWKATIKVTKDKYPK